MRDAMVARGLIRRGVEARMYRLHGGEALEEETVLDGAVPVSFCPSDNPGVHPHLQTSAVLKAALRDFAPDVVLYKGLGYCVNADTQAALAPATRHGFIVGGGTTDPLLDSAALVLGEYPEQLRRCFRPLLRAGRALVLPKHIDFTLAGDGEPVSTEAADYDIINVGTFGEARKNQAALAPFAARHRIALVGAGPLAREVRAAVLPRHRERLSLLGRLPHAQVFATLRRARIMVHTSTMDGLPRATVEAMACGVPVIAYRSTIDGGIPHGRGGLLVAEAALPHAVDMLLADEEMRITMGRAARRHAERHHGEAAIDIAAAEVLALLSA